MLCLNVEVIAYLVSLHRLSVDASLYDNFVLGVLVICTQLLQGLFTIPVLQDSMAINGK